MTVRHPFRLGEIYMGKKIVSTFYRALNPNEPKVPWIKLEDGSEIRVSEDVVDAPQG